MSDMFDYYLSKSKEQALKEYYLISYLVEVALKENYDVSKIIDYLELENKHNFDIFTMVLCALCRKMPKNLSKIDKLDVQNEIIELRSWLSEQKKVELDSLPDKEKKIVLYLANGYLLENLIGKISIDNNVVKKSDIDSLVSHCGVDDIIQAMAVMSMSNPDLKKIEKSVNLFKQISKD